jgi:hypothetical protein
VGIVTSRVARVWSFPKILKAGEASANNSFGANSGRLMFADVQSQQVFGFVDITM